MEIVLLAARLVLAGVFLIAGIAKLVDPAGTRKSIVSFGLPADLATHLAWLLPLAEIATAAALIPVSSSWWGAGAALSLLVVFTTAIGINLASGRRPDCNCFGQIHSEPIGGQTLVRNGIFAVAAGFILMQGPANTGPSVIVFLSGFTSWQAMGAIAGMVLALVMAAQAWFVIHLARQNGRLMLRMAALEARVAVPSVAQNAHIGLPLGAPAPEFQLPDLSGEEVSLADLTGNSKPVLLVFTAPNCPPCSALLPDIHRWQRDLKDRLTIALISQGTRKENLDKGVQDSSLRMLLQSDSLISRAYMAEGTPSAVVVLPDGTIGSSLAIGGEEIASLVTRVASTVETLSGLPRGSNAIEFELPDLSGEKVSLTQFRGRHVLLIFFNPDCGYCTQMIADLGKLPVDGSAGYALPLLVSAGSLESNRRMVEIHKLHCRLLLQGQSNIADLYGANGTPMGYLLDEQGRILSDLAAGAQALLELSVIRDRVRREVQADRTGAEFLRA